jgi:hypothetical protein
MTQYTRANQLKYRETQFDVVLICLFLEYIIIKKKNISTIFFLFPFFLERKFVYCPNI